MYVTIPLFSVLFVLFSVVGILFSLLQVDSYYSTKIWKLILLVLGFGFFVASGITEIFPWLLDNITTTIEPLLIAFLAMMLGFFDLSTFIIIIKD